MTKFALTLPGGRRGLLVNSTNLCAKVSRATARFTAQNGKEATLHPKMKNACSKRATKRHGKRRG